MQNKYWFHFLVVSSGLFQFVVSELASNASGTSCSYYSNCRRWNSTGVVATVTPKSRNTSMSVQTPQDSRPDPTAVHNGGYVALNPTSQARPLNPTVVVSTGSPSPSLVPVEAPVLPPSFYVNTQDGLVPVEAPVLPPSFYVNTQDGKSGLSPLEKVLIGMAIVIAVIVSATTFIIISRHRLKRLRHGLNQETNPNVENFLLNNEYLDPKRYKYSQIKKITSSFRDKLGQGGYGSVYKGMLPDGRIVAVKILKEITSNGEGFINEVGTISKTSHVNIVNLLGFCYERNRGALVYEFMPKESLDKFINVDGSVNKEHNLDLDTLFRIAVGVARGLEYLHKGCKTRIVHFDIKPQNILLDEDFCPKISDFGLAKLCKKQQSFVSIAGTVGTTGYIAPEVFSRIGGASHKSDVYSYGMMVLQMAGARNFSNMGSIQSCETCFPDRIYDEVVLRENQNLDDILSAGEAESTRKMFLVGFWCIQTAPSDRPSMSEVVDMLEGSVESIKIPPKPYLFNPPNVELKVSVEA